MKKHKQHKTITKTVIPVLNISLYTNLVQVDLNYLLDWEFIPRWVRILIDHQVSAMMKPRE
jgi:hypothetical protein